VYPTHICLEDLNTPFAKRLLQQRGQPKKEKPPDMQGGDLCPDCGEARLRFDSLLNLACPACKFLLAGGFT
jgi:hypothetical protein